MKRFNIKDTMYIHIRTKGWEHLNIEYGSEYVDKCIKPNKVIINEKEYYAMQCWNVFNTLPASLGFDMLFEPNVLFADSNLKNI